MGREGGRKWDRVLEVKMNDKAQYLALFITGCRQQTHTKIVIAMVITIIAQHTEMKIKEA